MIPSLASDKVTSTLWRRAEQLDRAPKHGLLLSRAARDGPDGGRRVGGHLYAVQTQLRDAGDLLRAGPLVVQTELGGARREVRRIRIGSGSDHDCRERDGN